MVVKKVIKYRLKQSFINLRIEKKINKIKIDSNVKIKFLLNLVKYINI